MIKLIIIHVARNRIKSKKKKNSNNEPDIFIVKPLALKVQSKFIADDILLLLLFFRDNKIWITSESSSR